MAIVHGRCAGGRGWCAGEAKQGQMGEERYSARRAPASVLQRAPGAEDDTIELVASGSRASTLSRLRSVVT